MLYIILFYNIHVMNTYCTTSVLIVQISASVNSISVERTESSLTSIWLAQPKLLVEELAIDDSYHKW